MKPSELNKTLSDDELMTNNEEYVEARNRKNDVRQKGSTRFHEPCVIGLDVHGPHDVRLDASGLDANGPHFRKAKDNKAFHFAKIHGYYEISDAEVLTLDSSEDDLFESRSERR